MNFVKTHLFEEMNNHKFNLQGQTLTREYFYYCSSEIPLSAKMWVNLRKNFV
jgi:hypothetical protein